MPPLFYRMKRSVFIGGRGLLASETSCALALESARRRSAVQEAAVVRLAVVALGTGPRPRPQPGNAHAGTYPGTSSHVFAAIATTPPVATTCTTTSLTSPPRLRSSSGRVLTYLHALLLKGLCARAGGRRMLL